MMRMYNRMPQPPNRQCVAEDESEHDCESDGLECPQAKGRAEVSGIPGHVSVVVVVLVGVHWKLLRGLVRPSSTRPPLEGQAPKPLWTCTTYPQ